MVETDIRREVLSNIRFSLELYALEQEQSTSLKGFCGIASWCIKEEFYELNPQIIWGYFNRWEPHCWIEIDDILIDITATQFNGIKEKILVGPRNEFSYYSNREVMMSLADFKYFHFPPTPENTKKILTRARSYLS